MRPITNLTLCALAAAALTAPAFAASNSYLQLGPITEEELNSRKGRENKIEVLSWSFGVTHKGWDGSIKGATSAEKFGAVSGMHRDAGVNPVLSKVEGGDGRAEVTSPHDAASGMPTGKRQHGPVTFTKPLDRGSVRVKVKLPWLDCRVGAAFPDAVLQNDAGRYELKDVVISGCARESVALNYSKVTVRGWDPAKKEN